MRFDKWSKGLFRDYFRSGGLWVWTPIVGAGWCVAAGLIFAMMCIFAYESGENVGLEGF